MFLQMIYVDQKYSIKIKILSDTMKTNLFFVSVLNISKATIAQAQVIVENVTLRDLYLPVGDLEDENLKQNEAAQLYLVGLEVFLWSTKVKRLVQVEFGPEVCRRQFMLQVPTIELFTVCNKLHIYTSVHALLYFNEITVL